MKLVFRNPGWDSHPGVNEGVWKEFELFPSDDVKYSRLWDIDTNASNRSMIGWQPEYCLRMIAVAWSWE